MKDKLPNFAAKALSVVRIGEDVSRIVVDPRFELQAGRLFFIGTSPLGASKRDWMAGLDEALAWDRVQEYVCQDEGATGVYRAGLLRRPAGRGGLNSVGVLIQRSRGLIRRTNSKALPQQEQGRNGWEDTPWSRHSRPVFLSSPTRPATFFKPAIS